MPHFLLVVVWLWGFTPGFAVVEQKGMEIKSTSRTTHDRQGNHVIFAQFPRQRGNSEQGHRLSMLLLTGVGAWHDKVIALTATLVSASGQTVNDEANTHPVSVK